MSSAPKLAATEFGGPADAPPLLLGPSLGTSAESLWRSCAEPLTDRFRVVGWDLPGHGRSAPASGFAMEDLAAAVVSLADDLGAAHFAYAGDSIGGAVGLQLLLDAPERVVAATLLCTAAQIGSPESWRQRANLVSSEGTRTLLDTAPERWFAPGFADRDPHTTQALLTALADADDDSYAAACRALAAFEVGARLAEIAVPVVVVAGERDPVIPVPHARRIAAGVQRGSFVVLEGVGHLAPAEAPQQVTELVAAPPPEPTTPADVRAAGMRVRREVLGDAHVDRALDNTSKFTADFQDLITRYAWGDIWTRPGLDRRSRSLITLTALIARGHHEEFAMHVRAALRNDVTTDELRELLLHTAIYCGVPDANTAFRIAQGVLDEEEEETE